MAAIPKAASACMYMFLPSACTAVACALHPSPPHPCPPPLSPCRFVCARRTCMPSMRLADTSQSSQPLHASGQQPSPGAPGRRPRSVGGVSAWRCCTPRPPRRHAHVNVMHAYRSAAQPLCCTPPEAGICQRWGCALRRLLLVHGVTAQEELRPLTTLLAHRGAGPPRLRLLLPAAQYTQAPAPGWLPACADHPGEGLTVAEAAVHCSLVCARQRAAGTRRGRGSEGGERRLHQARRGLENYSKGRDRRVAAPLGGVAALGVVRATADRG